jgi:hypothetical protein
LQFHGTFYFAVDGQIFAAVNLALEDYGLSYYGGASTYDVTARFSRAAG